MNSPTEISRKSSQVHHRGRGLGDRAETAAKDLHPGRDVLGSSLPAFLNETDAVKNLGIWNHVKIYLYYKRLYYNII